MLTFRMIIPNVVKEVPKPIVVKEVLPDIVVITCSRCEWTCTSYSTEKDIVDKIRIHCLCNKGRHAIKVE